MEDYKIVPETDLIKYKRNARFGTVMAILAFVMVAGASFVVGWSVGRVKAFNEAAEQVDSLHNRYVYDMETFTFAWENQQANMKFVESVATYLKGRQESIDINRDMSPINRPSWKKRKRLQAESMSDR